MGLIPYVVEKTDQGERSYDIYSRLLKDRIVVLTDEVEINGTTSCAAQMLYLAAEDPNKDIYLYINSPGGVVTDGLALYDTMHYIKPDVVTICMGQAASMGAFLLAGGTKGKRFALPSARIMIHQVAGGAHGKGTDIQIQIDEIVRLKKFLTEELAKNCGKSYDEVYKDCERDYYMTADQAVEYGLIDKVIRTIDDAL